MSEREPEWLTEEQVARKQRAKRVVAAVVGALVAGLLFVAFRDKLGVLGPKARPTGASTVSGAPPSTSVVSPTTRSAAVPSASGAAQGGGGGSRGEGGSAGAGGSADTGGAGGAGGSVGAGGSAGSPGAGGAGGSVLPAVEDPLAEAKKLLNAGRYGDTIPMAKAAIAKDPENGDGYFYLGMAYQSIGKIEESKDAFDACVANAKTGANLNWCHTYARRK